MVRRGKALEHFSRHYGQAYKDQDTPMTVLEGLLGINQPLDEEAGGIKEPPPHNAEPFTRMLLCLFDGIRELPATRCRSSCAALAARPPISSTGAGSTRRRRSSISPHRRISQGWIGKHRRGMRERYDQAMFLISACFEGSGIDAGENEHFRPHPALGVVLTWFMTHGDDSPVRNAAITASRLYGNWESIHQEKKRQLDLFDVMGEGDG